MIDLLTPNPAALAAHARLESLPRIVRKLAIEGDDADANAARAAKLALKASFQKLYMLKKISAETGRKDAAMTTAIETAQAEIKRRKKCSTN